MADSKKCDIITFKVDRSLAEALRGVKNRSEFIRNALLQALENVCPLCGGTGTLTDHQRNHWESFSRNHSVEQCRDCDGRHIVCGSEVGKCPSGA